MLRNDGTRYEDEDEQTPRSWAADFKPAPTPPVKKPPTKVIQFPPRYQHDA